MTTAHWFADSARYWFKEESFFETGKQSNPNAKYDRDTRARQLRKEGWTVKTKTYSIGFFLDAKKEKPNALKNPDNSLNCPICQKLMTPYEKPYGINDPSDYGKCSEHGLFVFPKEG